MNFRCLLRAKAGKKKGWDFHSLVKTKTAWSSNKWGQGWSIRLVWPHKSCWSERVLSEIWIRPLYVEQCFAGQEKGKHEEKKVNIFMTWGNFFLTCVCPSPQPNQENISKLACSFIGTVWQKRSTFFAILKQWKITSKIFAYFPCQKFVSQK